MKTIRLVIAASLLCVSGLALADYSGTREDRMQSALSNYRNSKMSQGTSTTSSSGAAASNDSSVKRGAHNAGQAIKHGAQRVGHAVGTGYHKTRDALGNAGRKLKAKNGTRNGPAIGQKAGEQ